MWLVKHGLALNRAKVPGAVGGPSIRSRSSFDIVLNRAWTSSLDHGTAYDR